MAYRKFVQKIHCINKTVLKYMQAGNPISVVKKVPMHNFVWKNSNSVLNVCIKCLLLFSWQNIGAAVEQG